MTHDHDYYSQHRDMDRAGGSSRGVLWAGLAIIALLVIVSVFYVFGASAPENGSAAPALTLPQTDTAAPATAPASNDTAQ